MFNFSKQAIQAIKLSSYFIAQIVLQYLVFLAERLLFLVSSFQKEINLKSQKNGQLLSSLEIEPSSSCLKN